MKWAQPPDIKIYEALGALADGRVEFLDDTAKVYSSTRNKFYEVKYDRESSSIMANDNGSYWKGYLGYPAIAFLMGSGVLPYSQELADSLKGIAWKDVNQKFKNDFPKTLEFILTRLSPDVQDSLALYVKDVQAKIKNLNLTLFGKKQPPPEGY